MGFTRNGGRGRRGQEYEEEAKEKGKVWASFSRFGAHRRKGNHDTAALGFPATLPSCEVQGLSDPQGFGSQPLHLVGPRLFGRREDDIELRLRGSSYRSRVDRGNRHSVSKGAVALG